MITLAYPWLLLLLLVPLVVRWLVPPHREPRPSLHVPFLARLSQLTGQQAGQGASVFEGVLGRKLVMPFVWICLVLAMARPQWIEPPVSRTKPMRDLLVAVDLSGSMETQDFTDAGGKTSARLTAVKQVLDGFLAKREGDRVGLIFFGTAAFVQAPFTEDLSVCRQLLGEAQVKMAGPQTAFGDAIGLGITMFDRSPMKQKVMIVLTDGNDTSSQVPPAKAAEIAKGKGIVIHTVSVGDPTAAGEQALDVPTLQTVAKETGGVYSAASDRKQLEQIYGKLDTLEAHASETVSRRPKRDVHHWPLAIGFVVTLGYQAILLIWRAIQSREQRVVTGKGVPA
ncbi:MAG: VWA domain-containing protein [Verrucomicrobiaceae bacterium]|nr:MAG: VWA domain-containing protein [Verrucomicrobiaceae bacterium]